MYIHIIGPADDSLVLIALATFQDSKRVAHPLGLKVIKLELILRLKIKRNDWLVRKQPIIALYFESDTVLKFYNLEARSCKSLH